MDVRLSRDCVPLVTSKTRFIQEGQVDSEIGNDGQVTRGNFHSCECGWEVTTVVDGITDSGASQEGTEGSQTMLRLQ